MRKQTEKPPVALYQAIETAYQHFNVSLFKGELPDVLFTVQRQAGTLGYFVPDRWSSPSGQLCHEIAINPAHMGRSRVIDVLQTLAHEMSHCWQFCLGTPSSQGYHNKEWAYKMIEIGLQPSSTGKPGGAITGMLMSDYVIEGGPFWVASIELIQKMQFQFPWICRLTTASAGTASENLVVAESGAPETPPKLDKPSVEDILLQASEDEPAAIDLLFSNYSDLLPPNTFQAPPQRGKAKSKYQCSGCRLKVWGKPGLKILCMECNTVFSEF